MADINDQILQNQVQFNRIINGLIRSDLLPALKANNDEIRLLLLEAEQITSATQLNRIVSRVSQIVRQNSLPAWESVTYGLDKMAEYEASFIYSSLVASGIVANQSENVTDYVAKSLMSLEGRNPITGVWSDFVKANVNGQAELINNQIKSGYVNGDTVRQISSRIRQATNGIIKDRVENLARTGVAHYSSQAKKAFAEDNKDVIKREYPIVTFDRRLSVTCAGIGAKYSEKGWPVGESPIGYPPYHYSCRTVIGYKVIGQKSTPAKDVNEWLDRQPKEFQEDVLGKTRAEAFRDGVKLEKFTDATQRPLTIDELKSREVIKEDS